MDLKEEIKNSIKLSHVVGKNLSLKRRDKSNYVALCPFHKEKTPSFNVSDDKGFYHCFGCGKNGDIFNYVMEMENINFVEDNIITIFDKVNNIFIVSSLRE